MLAQKEEWRGDTRRFLTAKVWGEKQVRWKTAIIHQGGEPGLWAAGQKGIEAQWKPQAPRGAGRGTTSAAGALEREKLARCAGTDHRGWRTERKTGERRGGGGGGTGIHLTQRAEAAQLEDSAGGGARGSNRFCTPAASRPVPCIRLSLFSPGNWRRRRATTGRRSCFQPHLMTWRPTSCHRGCSGLPPLWWRRHLCLPAPPPSAHPSRPGSPRPRSIERERLERKRRGRTTIEYTAWMVRLLVNPLTVLPRQHPAGSEGQARGCPHAQFVVFTSARPSRW